MRDVDPELHELPELHALRAWNAGARPLTDEARHRARVRLFATMSERPSRPARLPRRGRLVPRIALAGAVAAAVTATLLVTTDEEGRPPGAPVPERMDYVSAVTVLDRAAARERRNGPRFAPRGDQFVYTRTVGVKEGSRERYVDENWYAVDPHRSDSWISEQGKGWWSGVLPKDNTLWPTSDWAELRTYPTDPDRLIKQINHYTSSAEKGPKDLDREEWAGLFHGFASLMWHVPVMPEGLKPAVYRAMSRIPGVKATRGVQDLRGRPGVGVFFPLSPRGSEAKPETFVFDEKTYEYLGRCQEWEGQRCVVGSYLETYGVTDEAKRRP
ncbi:CU044_5270 family protein [Streptomyces huiliensis]|uniref:CU044_5270 family protein n=1 Tax=Streptomyces huiliensis TaxID=2876027 RepID=UPI001CBF799B|nr:CU044_5270 family protein [Streptomyces huiliensis]MBZ4318759.1 CU044_5270 family protein [Streptomyces huiliensis]